MSATVRRYHVVDFVVRNRRPLAVYFDFVMVADHTALSRRQSMRLQQEPLPSFLFSFGRAMGRGMKACLPPESR
jgi:hypothetical protein